MKTFTNITPRDFADAVKQAQQARAAGQSVAFAGGGSDALGMLKERLIAPDALVHLGAIKGQDRVESSAAGGVRIGGLITLDALAHDATIRRQFTVLAEAAEGVATPQIRNVGTLAGNVCQRPWCWYYRNGFQCFKNGGNTCYSASGENQYHAIFGGGPSYIVHPSDTAPALVALGATFHLVGAGGPRDVPAESFFTLPTVDAGRENVLRDDEVLAAVTIPAPRAGATSTYHKILDREAWTHAIVSAAVVLDMDGGICRGARIVLGGVAPIPWRVAEAERLLVGQRLTPDLAENVGAAAVAGARPLPKNGYKVPMTRAMVRRTIEGMIA